MKFMRSILVLALLSSGCASSMQMSSEDLNRLTPTEGIVVGSVQIKDGKDILGRTGWMLLAQRIRGALSSLVPPCLEYSLNASGGRAEEVFVTKMEAGEYQLQGAGRQERLRREADRRISSRTADRGHKISYLG